MSKKLITKLFISGVLLFIALPGCNKQGPRGKQGEQGIPGEQGEPGQDGRSIVSIEYTSSEGNVDTYTITYSDGTTSTFTVTNGEDGGQGIQGNPGQDGHTPVITISDDGYWVIDGVKTDVKAQGPQGPPGQDGRGIVSISYTSSENNVDTYTILYTDGTTSTFTVTNGLNGGQGIQGNPGADGHTPIITIGDNGNWFVDGVDTGVKAQGPQGPVGPQGPAGDNGATWLTGNTAPDNSLGHNGDLYLDNTTYDIYLKTNGEWDKIGNIKGIDGGNGRGIANIQLVSGEIIVTYTTGEVVNLGSVLPYEDTSPFRYRLLSNGTYAISATEYAYDATLLNIPSTYSDRPVTTIEPMGFYYLPNLDTINIPDSITEIGESAFKNCYNLSSLYMRENLLSIGASAFENCKALTLIDIPSTVNFIGRYAFYNTSLASVTFEAGVSSYKVKDPRVTNPVDSTGYQYQTYVNKFLETKMLVYSYTTGSGSSATTYSYSPYILTKIFTDCLVFKCTSYYAGGGGGSTSYTYSMEASIYLTDLIKA